MSDLEETTKAESLDISNKYAIKETTNEDADKTVCICKLICTFNFLQLTNEPQIMNVMKRLI